jgi:hypothetical protein
VVPAIFEIRPAMTRIVEGWYPLHDFGRGRCTGAGTAVVVREIVDVDGRPVS